MYTVRKKYFQCLQRDGIFPRKTAETFLRFRDRRSMGKKDLAEKKLEDYNDVFADIFNTLLFGRKEIDPQCLKQGVTASIYKTEQKELHEQFRDTMKEYQDAERYVIASYGIENQSGYDADMPIRVMGYDYGNYRKQLLDEKKPLHPVVTIVLNFSDTRWIKNKSLHELLQLSEQQKEYVQDYRIRVFDIAFLSDEVIEQFQSDFKVAARFFKEKRLGNEPFKGREMPVKHIEALLELFSVFTGDRTYEEMVPYARRQKEKGRKIEMCWVVQGYINEGKQEEAALNARMLLKNGVSMELVAASIQSITAEKLQEIYEEVQAEKV